MTLRSKDGDTRCMLTETQALAVHPWWRASLKEWALVV